MNYGGKEHPLGRENMLTVQVKTVVIGKIAKTNNLYLVKSLVTVPPREVFKGVMTSGSKITLKRHFDGDKIFSQLLETVAEYIDDEVTCEYFEILNESANYTEIYDEDIAELEQDANLALTGNVYGE